MNPAAIHINKLEVNGATLEETIANFQQKFEAFLMPKEYDIKVVAGATYMYLFGEWAVLLDNTVITAKKSNETLYNPTNFFNTLLKTVDTITDVFLGAAGLAYGIIEGILRGIYDALEGIVDFIGAIIETIEELINGTLLDKLKDLYYAIIKIADLNIEQLKELLYGILGNIGDAIKKIIENWHNATAFEKGKVVGIIVGAILLEVLVAIFSGGVVSVAKWAGKLGKFGKVLTKIGKIGDDLKDALKKNKKLDKLFKKGAYENDKDDGDNWQRWALLQQARVTAETMDANGNTVEELRATLNLTEKLYPDLGNVKWPKKKIKDDIYYIGMKASDEKWVDKHFSSGDEEGLEKHTKGFYNGVKPKYENPGHHDRKSSNFRGGGSKTELIPENAEVLYKRAIPGFTNDVSKQGIPKKWYSIDKNGKIHQFTVDHNENSHWAGSENGPRGISIDNSTRKRLLKYYKEKIK